MSSMGNIFFAISTMLVAVPTGIKIFNWLATMYGGKIRFELPMLFCLGLPVSVPDRGTDRHHAGRGALRLAADRFLLRRGALPLRA